MNGIFHPSLFETHDTNLKHDNTIFDNTTFPGNDKIVSTASKSLPMFKEDFQNNYNCNAYSGIHSKNIVNQLFFSQKNIDNIQKLIRYTIYKQTNFIIGKQSQTELLIIMRSIYLQYSKNPVITNISNQKNILTQEINNLNKIIVNFIAPNIVNEVQQYLDYLRDISKNATPIERSKNESVKGTKQFRDITEIFSI